MHINVQAWSTGVVLVGAALAVLYRWVIRPLLETGRWVRERVEEWSETVEAVRELIPLVASVVVESDRRLTRLEALAGIPLEPLQPGRTPPEVAAQLRSVLRDPTARTRRDDYPKGQAG